MVPYSKTWGWEALASLNQAEKFSVQGWLHLKPAGSHTWQLDTFTTAWNSGSTLQVEHASSQWGKTPTMPELVARVEVFQVQ